MSSADMLHLRSKSHLDDEHDHIGSGASTPPGGTATPNPDFVDKRLPGIINTYFTQVRNSLSGRSASRAVSINPASSERVENEPPEEKRETSPRPSPAEGENDDAASTEQPESPLDASDCDSSPPLLPHETPSISSAAYPTPPLSNSSSIIVMTNAGSSGNIEQTSCASSKRSFPEKDSNLASISSQLRRLPLSSATPCTVATPDVAGHISNPTSDALPTYESANPLASRRVSSRHSDKPNRKLTNGALPYQNTPPHTPRSSSHESKRTDETETVTRASKTSGTSSTGDGATIGQNKGQLEITIEEGRGLRPSIDPYVVCIFQLNEDISGGPKEEDKMDTAIDGAYLDPEENLARGAAMRRLGSGSGTPMAIPGLRSRQTSQTNMAAMNRKSENAETTEPVWRHTASFDVVGENSEVDVSVYDRANNEAFIGHVRLPVSLEEYEHQHEDWYKLQSREGQTDIVSGEVRLKIAFHASGKKTFRPEDFEILKLIGKGTFGQVFQVRKRDNQRIYAMKVLSKKVIVQKKEIQHTIGERNILVRTATTESPFIVGLKFSFQTAADLYLVTDYMSGGELFWHLQKEGRFVEERAKFYIAELILALRHLHQHDIVYRDLKPENILLDANGHIALCDFGLSKANLAKNDTTNTFCGTTEYLAPEVLLDEQGYTKMVDFWSLGVLVFEMCCGWSPFYAEDTQQMYKNIAFGKVRFPRDALSAEGRNFVKGLLNRNPAHRLGAKGDAEELMAHPFFADVDWNALSKKLTQPPFKPKLKGELDTSNFDPEFTNALNNGDASSLNARAAALASGVCQGSTPLSPTMQNQFKGFTFVDESTLEQQYADRDVGMDGHDDGAVKGFGGRAGDRMSGVEPQSATSTNADADFNHGMLDDI
ncbi:Hypothetical protein R9X50_00499700 [Acrodontium crateriforme]|uniref:non-specific serine/threonine protein kinase n=1 Tax=Acrodontium crateriforme TaxID=150365 RepID=A0AAQ3M584_9PEZI|nr:Hypothetical protein R9X50_00499700 [Acrodontium crateriforme]